jgi:hypothetical protein
MATIRQGILYLQAKDTKVSDFVLCDCTDLCDSFIRWRELVVRVTGAELHALISAWKDLEILLSALSAVAINRRMTKKEQAAVEHLLYLQRWFKERKSPSFADLTVGVSAASKRGRSAVRHSAGAAYRAVNGQNCSRPK